MGRKKLERSEELTKEVKRQADKNYYEKYKEEHRRFYQLSSMKCFLNKQLKVCEEKLKILSVNPENSVSDQLKTQIKIDKLNARIAKYKEQLPIISAELEVERAKKWNSDYHTKAVYKQKLLSKEDKDAINTQLSHIEEQIAEIRTKIGQIENLPVQL